MESVTLVMNIDQLRELKKIAMSSKSMSDDLTDNIYDLYIVYQENITDQIYQELSHESCKYLHTMLESVAYTYKMSEGTDPDFIYFLLGLEQHIEDTKNNI